ncbi:ISC system 2Fe-2S type ferredoxin [Massilia sp. WF1]|uniref:ISC system 2Fe-2S type ferredoxin n=1 Tax=Massilia sp. WF1 TaxID=1406431 RepID=UPI0009FE0796|nr:ISC system 2Fe-2S type ferredoxin [Massilia sp. WF1]
MPKIEVNANPDYAPEGASFEVQSGKSLCDALLEHGIEIEHACGKVGACTTCHVIVRAGASSLPVATDKEEDMLDRAWGLEPTSRLSCQAAARTTDLVIEIPRYSINHAKELP